MVSAPALRRRWWAGAGEGAFTSFGGATRRISVSGVDDLGVGQPVVLRPDHGLGSCAAARFLDLTDAVWRVRGYGDFWSYCLVAEGAVDIAAEPEVNAVGPGAARHPGARGRRPFHQPGGTAGPHGGSAVATNGLLHDAVLTRLNGA